MVQLCMGLRRILVLVSVSLVVFGQVSVYADTFSQINADDSLYCQTVTVCGSAPKEFTQIIAFSYALLNAIKTMGTQGDYLGQYVNPNRFEGNTFTPPQQNIASKAVKNVQQKLDFLLADTAIFTSPQQLGGIKDLLGGILVLFKNEVFKRDFQVVEQLDAAVTTKRYELGLGGGWYTKVNDANVAKFQQIITSYKNNGLLDSSSNISQGVLYNNITAMVGSIDAALKAFFALDNTDQFSRLRQNGGSDGIRIRFSGNVIMNMQKQYTCARGIVSMCDESRATFTQNIEKISSDAQSGVQKSMKTITDAVKRLKQTFSSAQQDDAFKAREQQLLKSYYGSKKIASGGLLDFTMDDGGTISSRRSLLVSSDTQTSSLEKIKTSNITSTPISEDDFGTAMTNSLRGVLTNQAEDLKQAEFGDVKDFSMMFDTLGRQILAAKTIIGNKDSDGTLIKELGDSCELQCGGGGKCR